MLQVATCEFLSRANYYLCPVCKNRLERYDYTKQNQAKSLLRCDDPQARANSNHKNAVFFLTRQNQWWNKDFGRRK